MPIAASIGDQQASLVGHLGLKEGSLVATYGTGGFIKYNLGDKVKLSEGLLTTVAYTTEKRRAYMFESSIFIAGALFQWLIESLKIVRDFNELEELAKSVEDTGDVFFVPAFAGLGAPYWDETARGLIIGMTRKTSREHIIRVAMESLAYKSKDVLSLIEKAVNHGFSEMHVGGGVAQDNFLIQLLAGILGIRIIRPKIIETTAMGAAIMAGLAVGLWSDYQRARENSEKR